MMRTKTNSQSQNLGSEVEMSTNLGVKAINVKPKISTEMAHKKKKSLKSKQQPAKKKSTANKGFLGSSTELLKFLAKSVAAPPQKAHTLRAMQRIPSKLQARQREAKQNEPLRRRPRRRSDVKELANILASYMIAQSGSVQGKPSEQRQIRSSLSPTRTNKRLKSNAEIDFGVQQSAAKMRDKNENVRLPLVLPKETLLHKTQSKLKSHTTTDYTLPPEASPTVQKEQKQPRKTKLQKLIEVERADEETPTKKLRRPSTPIAYRDDLQKVTKIPVPKGDRPSSNVSINNTQKRIVKVISKDERPSSATSTKEEKVQTQKKARKITELTADTPGLPKKSLKKKESKQICLPNETKKQLTTPVVIEKTKRKQKRLSDTFKRQNVQLSSRSSSDSTLKSLTLTRSEYSMSSEPGTIDINLRKLNEIVTNFKEEITHVVQNTSQNNSQSSKKNLSSKKKKVVKSPLSRKKSLIPVLKKFRKAKVDIANEKQELPTKRPATGDVTRQKKQDSTKLDNGDMVLIRGQTNPPTAKTIEDVVKRRKPELKTDKETGKPKQKKSDESHIKKSKKGKMIARTPDRSPSDEILIDLPTPSYEDTLAEYKSITDATKFRFQSKSAANLEKKLELQLKSSRSHGMIPKLALRKKKDSEKKEQNKCKNTNTKSRKGPLNTKQSVEICEKRSIKFGDQMDSLKTLHGNIQALAESNESLTSGILAASKYDITIESFVKFTQEQLSQFKKPFGQLEVQKSDASTTTLDRFQMTKTRKHAESQTEFKLVMVGSPSKSDLGPVTLKNDEYVQKGMDLAKKGLTDFFSIVQTTNKADLVPKLNDNPQLIADTCALSFDDDQDVHLHSIRSQSNVKNNRILNTDKVLIKKFVKVEQYLNLVMYYYRLALETKHSLDNMVKCKISTTEKTTPRALIENGMKRLPVDTKGPPKMRKMQKLFNKQLKSKLGQQSLECDIPKSVNMFNASMSRMSFKRNGEVFDITQTKAVYEDNVNTMRISFARCSNEIKRHQFLKNEENRKPKRKYIDAIVKRKGTGNNHTKGQKPLTNMTLLDKLLPLILKNQPEQYTNTIAKALHLLKLSPIQPTSPSLNRARLTPRRSGSKIELKRIYAGHQIHMAQKNCECKEDNLLGEALADNFSSSKKNVFDDDEDDDHYEHYLQPLVDHTTAVHYDQMNPTGSILSLPPVQVETDKCFDESRMEIPWLSITLPPPGSLIIKGKQGFCLRKPICECWRMNPEESECQESPPPEENLFEKTCTCRDEKGVSGVKTASSPPLHIRSPVSPPPNTEAPSLEMDQVSAPSELQPAEQESASKPPPVTEIHSEEQPRPADEELFEPALDGHSPAEIEEVPSNCICVDHVPKEMRDCSDIKPLEFVYNNANNLYYEPYMDSWYCDFPDDLDTPCGPNTEIPWHELLIPRNVKLKAKPRAKSGPEGDPNMAMVKVEKNEMEKYCGKPRTNAEGFDIQLSFAEFVETRSNTEKKCQGVTPKSSKTSRASKQVCACFESSGKKRHHHHRHHSSKRNKDKGTHKHSSHNKRIHHGTISPRSSKTKKGGHKSKTPKSNYKAEIISALDTCEAEMAPIRSALNDLKAKIQNITASAIDVDYDRCNSVNSGVGCGAPMPQMMPPMGSLPGMGYMPAVSQMDSIATFTGIGPPPCGMGVPAGSMGPLPSMMGPPPRAMGPPQHGPLGPPLPSPYGPPPFISPKVTSSTNACKCRSKKSDKNAKGAHKHHLDRHK